MIKGKKLFVAILALTVVLSGSLGIGMIVSAAETSVFSENDYTLSSNVGIRLSYDEQSVLNMDKNGIRCKTSLPKGQYKELLKLNGRTAAVKFGILLAPAAYATENELTEANVFGKNRVYATNYAQQADDMASGKNTKLIDCVELSEMIEGATDYYAYYYFTDFAKDAVMSDYVIKPYLVKYSYNKYGIAESTEYNFVSEQKQINIVYLVQKALEGGIVGNYSDDLQALYVNGRKGNLQVEYKISYDGD